MKTARKNYAKWITVLPIILTIYLVWGYFGFEGAWIPGKYDAVTNTYKVLWSKSGFKCENGYFRIKAYTPFKKHALCDTMGNIIVTFQYEYVDDMSENDLVIVGNKGKYGVINNHGRIIIPVEYQYIQLNENYIHASVDSVGGILSMKSKAFDFTGKPIFPVDWLDYLISNTKNTYNKNPFLVGVKDSVSYLYFFESMKMQKKDVAIHSFQTLDEKAKVAHIMTAYNTSAGNRSAKYALMDDEGNDLLPYQYDFINPTVNDVFIVQKGNVFGVYDAKSRSWVLPLKYGVGDISIMLNGNLIGTKYGQHFRYTDRNGAVILSERNQVIDFDNTFVNFIHQNGIVYNLVYDELKSKFFWYRGKKTIK